MRSVAVSVSLAELVCTRSLVVADVRCAKHQRSDEVAVACIAEDRPKSAAGAVCWAEGVVQACCITTDK